MKAIDLFAGCGGSTLGARAVGIDVVWAANHWKVASDTHALNHPETVHSCQDLQQQNWLLVPAHDLFLCSPSCQGHTPARGVDLPRHDAARATAWAGVSCAEVHRPEGILFENVPAFLKWVLYPAFELALKRLGYTLSAHVLDAADHGVPQHRRRLFIIGTRSEAPFILRPIQRPHVPFSAIVDADAGGWSAVSRRCPKTRQRVKNGRRAFGRQFLMPYYSSGSGLTGRSVDRPLGTVTTKDRWALVEGRKSRMLNVTEYRRAMGFPEDYILPGNVAMAKHMLGNAVPPQMISDVLTDFLARA